MSYSLKPPGRRPRGGSVSLALATVVTAATVVPVTILAATGTTPPTTNVAGSADNVVDHVVAISVDGLNPRALSRLGRARTPAFHRVLGNGASTRNARTLYESTSTLPNHTGMLTGRRVTASRGGHGVSVNHDPGGTVHDKAGEYVASVFDVVHDHGGATALYAGKSKFALFNRSWSSRWGLADQTGVDNGRDKIDRYVMTENTSALVDRLRRQLRNSPPEFSLLHLRLPDAAGHEHGFMSTEYLRAVRRTDTLLGRVLHTIRDKRSLRRHTAVILTADHGGRGGSHRKLARLANYRIPFAVWGASTTRGAGLYALNPDRRRPGSSRPTYARRQPVRNAEVANVAADLLDLPAVAGSQLNPLRNLDTRR